MDIAIPGRYKNAFQRAKEKGFNVWKMTTQERRAFEWWERERRRFRQAHQSKKNKPREALKSHSETSNRSGKVTTFRLSPEELQRYLEARKRK
ncbi:hypothetical protein SRCM101294_00760 [Bacillus amyloliquefaciens]|uniref:hypothetical protein n=1 Tax=Bacillus subtilis group TaxID=653685 RepID=UPI00080C35E8|nr:MULTISPECIES: hypothetical protein [Bacillus subtilis group]OCB98106.1 hypothetical protein SRCM101294_00760 [Bacillus amyloliquefaciens]QEO08543.1 hypothetical protein FLQ07_23500 [Bacillus paralicheniformis]HEO2443871.1 hypothetical protein [Streptococcus agalactiae]